MKKNILAIAIASAVAAPVAMADAPTVYGQFNVAIDSTSIDKHDTYNLDTDTPGTADSASAMDVVNRNSRVGVKGSSDLGNGLKAVYQLETTVNVPNGGDKKSSFGGARNTFVGVAGGFGTVVMGRHDSPLRMIQPSDGFADSAYAGNNTSNFNGNLSGEDRLDEVVAYLSPDFNGIKFAVALSGQKGLEGTNDAGVADDQALTNGTSMNVTYGSKKSGIFAAVGQTTAVGGDYSVTRATVQYNEAGLLASFMYNQEKDVGNSMTIGAAYKMGALTPRAKMSMITYDKNFTDESATNMAIGVDYALGKTTRVYAEYAALGENSLYTTVAANGDEILRNASRSAMSVGLFHKF